MSDIKVSVIVPVYNVEKYLRRCMDSLLVQTLTDKEIILVDDGSTDNSGIICDDYARLPEVKVIHQANAGLGMARNKGMEMAVGEYIMFVDSDDYLGETLVEHLYQECKIQKADIGISGYIMVYPNGQQETRRCTDKTIIFAEQDVRQVLLDTIGSLPEDMLDSKFGANVWAKLYRKSVIETYGLCFVSERELISEDLIFNIDYLNHAKKVVITGEVDYFYCIYKNSLSKRHREDRFEQDYKLCMTVKERLSVNFTEEEYDLYLKRLFISRARFDIMQEVEYYDAADKSYLLYQSIKKIVHQVDLQEALRHYPWYNLPIMQGVFALMIRQKQVRVIIWLVRIKKFMSAKSVMR